VGAKAGLPHGVRPEFSERCPVLVTSSIRAGLPSLRRPAEYGVVLGAFRDGCRRFGMRLVHFAVLGNHVHYLVEARGRRSLTRGLKGLHVRVAKRLNRYWRRRGNVFPERFHARVLESPREVWGALAYVLKNARRHGYAQRPFEADRFSSGRWFEGWCERGAVELPVGAPVVRAATWLLRQGWRRIGLVVLHA
jgi:REP element-mobilizing transposase RayT